MPDKVSRWAKELAVNCKQETQGGTLAIVPQGNTCQLCGAWKGQFGLEPTIELYVEHSIEILREIRRVLRPDGVVFYNLGDSYAGSGGAHNENHASPGISNSFNRNGVPHYGNLGIPGRYLAPVGLKPKDLCLIPFRIALAAQADGWWVRSVIIWSKPNPMPESVRDRPTNSYEYILMLTKSSRYYWDAEAVREANSPLTDWNDRPLTSGDKADENVRPNSGPNRGICFKSNFPVGRNLRDVWEFPTQPYPEAHFATFPEELPERCIKAATSENCCSKCGAPWERVVEKSGGTIGKGSWVDHSEDDFAGKSRRTGSKGKAQEDWETYQVKTIGWRPTCNCNADKEKCLVLDCFAGSGTTLWVAKKLGRKAVGYEISPEYCELIVKRNRQQVMI